MKNNLSIENRVSVLEIDLINIQRNDGRDQFNENTRRIIIDIWNELSVLKSRVYELEHKDDVEEESDTSE